MTHKIYAKYLLTLSVLISCFASLTFAQSAVSAQENLNKLIPKNWKLSTQKMQDQEFMVYAAPDQSALFAWTAFERQYNPEFILEEFLKNMKVQMPTAEFEPIMMLKENTFYQIKVKSAGIEMLIAAIQQENQVVLAYTLNTPKTAHQALLQSMLSKIETS